MQLGQNWSKEDEHFSTKTVSLSQINQLFQKIQYPLCPHTGSLLIVFPYTGALLISVPMHRCPFHQCLHTLVAFPSMSPYTGAHSISVSIHRCPFDQFTLPQGCINGNKLPYIQSTSVVRHHNELLLHNQNESRVRYIFVTIQFLPLLLVTIGILFTKKSTTKTFVFATLVH